VGFIPVAVRVRPRLPFKLLIMRYIVTGGAGFLGSNLCYKLIANGHEVVCIDNLYTGSKKNIYKLLDSNSFKFHNIDVTEKFSFDCDGIFHLACPASPPKYTLSSDSKL